MLRALSPDRLARFSANHPWLTLAFWAVLIVASVASASSIKFDDEMSITNSDSYQAQRLIEQLRGGEHVGESVVVQSSTLTVDDGAYRAFVLHLTESLRALDGTVTSATNFYETEDNTLVSADRRTTVIPVGLAGEKVEAHKTVEPLIEVIENNSENDMGITVLTAGDGSINRDMQHAFEQDLQTGEMIGIPAAIVILVLVFGAAVAAGVPVIAGMLGIVVAVGVTALVSRVFGINSMVVNMIVMIGLAVGIDYTLFIIERFREERARGVAKTDAIVTAGHTASRAVLFSGLTVIVALAGLLIVPATMFQGMAIGAIAVVAAAVALALTLLPAVLSLLDQRIEWLHLPRRQARASHEGNGGFWGRTTALVMRYPVVAVVASVALLGGLAAPFVTINLGSAGLSQSPDTLASVRAFRILDREFSAGRIAPADVVIEGDLNSEAVGDAVERLRQQIAADPAFGQAGELVVNEHGTIGAMPVFVNGDPTEGEALTTVERLREDYVPAAFDGTGAKVYVGGNSASTIDYVDTMNRYLPIVIAFVLTLSFLLLTMVFRSIVIPVKAIIMNLLSVGASYGLLVIVFQQGVGADLLGFRQTETIEAFLPVFLFAVLFGLSMDYHVFLLSRIQERFLQTRDNAGAVAYGLRSTAHIITGAAAIMIAVFTGFALGDMVGMQQMGFGLAVAVFIDATIVRSVLVPASMALLGEWNWYMPSWLQWLPKINVEGGEQPITAPQPAPVLMPYGAYADFAGSGGD